MILNRNDVPIYLRDGDFFAALDPDDDGVFELPTSCLKFDTHIDSQEDLLFLLRSMRFWGVHGTPNSITQFMMLVDSSGAVDAKSFWLAELEEFKDILSPYFYLRNLQSEHRINYAILAKMGANIVQWLHENNQGSFSASNCGVAAKQGDLDTLRYLHEHGCPWDIQTTSAALFSGSIDCFEYARAYDCPVAEEGQRVYLAASTSLPMLQYLRGEGDQWSANTMLAPACTGKLHIVQYMHEAGCPWDEQVCAYAAWSGRLDCLQYLHEHGCPWDAHVPFYAALEGHYKCLKYAHENGCPWTNKANIAPLLRGHWRCFFYAVWHGSPEDALVVGVVGSLLICAMVIGLMVLAALSFCRLGVLLLLFSVLLAWVTMAANDFLPQVELELSVYVTPATQQKLVRLVPYLAAVMGVLFVVGLYLFVRNDFGDLMELLDEKKRENEGSHSEEKIV